MLQERRLFNLLSKKTSLSPQEKDFLQACLSKCFFKPLRTPINIEELIPHITIRQWQAEEPVFSQSDKIQEYFFLLEGTVNLYKGQQSGRSQLVSCASGPCILGEYFIHSNSNRSYNAFCTDRIGAKGFTINIEAFKTFAADLIKEYDQLKLYLSKFLNVDLSILNKTEIYYLVDHQTYSYNHTISCKKAVYIILQGECVMFGTEKLLIPTISQMNPVVKTLQSPILRLCQNDVINIDQYYDISAKLKSSKQYQYSVTSQQIVLLAIPFANISSFPLQFQSKLKSIFKIQSLKAEQHKNSTHSYQNLVNPNRPTESSIFASAKILKIKNSIGPDTLQMIRKTYCLGLNDQQMKVAHPKKKKVIQEVPVGYFKQKKKEKVKTVIEIPQRQWSCYVKLPKIMRKYKSRLITETGKLAASTLKLRR